MTPIKFVFLAFGDTLSYHRQTYFAILTALRHKRTDDKVVVYTDAVERYARLGNAVEVVALSGEKIAVWQAGRNYIFRVKIMSIMDCTQNDTSCHLLFMDGDTALITNSDEIGALLDAGKGLMHVDEGHPSRMKGASLRMWHAMNGREIGGCTISMKHNVWNSGVIGIPRGQGEKVCSLALNVCDAILDSGVKCFTAEQYAFSVAMQETVELHPAKPWIAHYWGNKPQWEQLTTDFLVNAHLCAMTPNDEIHAIDKLQLTDIPVHIRMSNTQRRLAKLIRRLFPDRVVE